MTGLLIICVAYALVGMTLELVYNLLEFINYRKDTHE